MTNVLRCILVVICVTNVNSSPILLQNSSMYEHPRQDSTTHLPETAQHQHTKSASISGDPEVWGFMPTLKQLLSARQTRRNSHKRHVLPSKILRNLLRDDPTDPIATSDTIWKDFYSVLGKKATPIVEVVDEVDPTSFEAVDVEPVKISRNDFSGDIMPTDDLEIRLGDTELEDDYPLVMEGRDGDLTYSIVID
jgi:hypothetical protein